MKRNELILFTFLCLVEGCAPVGPNYQRKDPVGAILLRAYGGGCHHRRAGGK
jgi:hypothetical protein